MKLLQHGLKGIKQIYLRNTLINVPVRLLSSSSNVIRSNIPDVDIPKVSLPKLIMDAVRTHGDQVAMVNSVTEEQHTYNDVVNNIERVSSALVQRGLRKNDIVSIMSPNCMEFCYALMATIYAGGTVTTVNPTYTSGELLYQLNDSKPKFLFSADVVSGTVQEACKQYDGMQELFSFGSTPGFTPFSSLLSDPAQPVTTPHIDSENDVVLLPYSSGTTGVAKGVMLTHHNIVANLHQAANPVTTFDLLDGAQETYIAVLPFFHIYGVFAIMLHAFRMGHKMVFVPRFEPTDYLKCIEKYQASFLQIVPPMAIALAKHPKISDHNLSSVHSALCAAAPLGEDLGEEFMKTTKIKIVKQGYGLTETGPAITLAPRTDWKFGSAGRLLPNTECKVVDLESGEALPMGERGEICVRGPQVMKGYLNKPEATADCIDSSGWFKTGDIGYIDENQDMYIVDRLKELIKYKGFQVPPAELEALLITHPSVADVAVIGVPHETGGEAPKAFVTLKPDANVTEDDIIKFVEDNAAPHKQLRGGVEFLPAIPKSPSGKILRRLLRDIEKNNS